MKNKVEIKRAVCEMCHSRCRVAVHSENGHLVTIEEDRSDPRVDSIFPPTRACLRLRGAKEWMYHPNRVNFPLRRAGEKGEGKWERISWEQALGEIAQRLSEIKQRYGAESLVSTIGTGRTRTEYQARFLNLFGTPNIMGQAKICFTPQIQSCALMFGRAHRHRMNLTLEKGASGEPFTKCVLLVGINPRESTLRLWKSVLNGKKIGVKIIVLDPRRTPAAELADIWLQLRPGTDTALLMSMINVVIEEGLYDKEFVEKWCYGFDKLAERAKEYPPERVAEITWVPADKIREAARMYANNRPATSVHGMGSEHLQNCIEAILARLSLASITGNIDILGGNILAESPVDPEKLSGMDMKPDTWNKALGDFPLLNLAHPIASHAGWRAVLTEEPYPVKAVLVHGCNTIVPHENARSHVYQAIMKLDFISVMDQFMTPTAELADIVMPNNTPFERDEIHCVPFKAFAQPFVLAAPRVIDSLWESRSDAEVFIDLCHRLGLDYGANTVTELLDNILLESAVGMSFEEFKERGWYSLPLSWRKYEQGLLAADGALGFNTRSHGIELYSKYLEELGLDPMPVPREPPESPVSSPELAKSYPLVLTTGLRSPVFFHSQYRQLGWLREIHPEPVVRIHPATASKFGIKDGDWVFIESPRGRCQQRAMLTIGIDPRVIMAEHGWWFPEKPAPEHGVWDSNINLLTDSEPPHDPGLGSSPVRSLLCRIYKAGEE